MVDMARTLSGVPLRDYPSSARVIELVDSRRQDSVRYNYSRFQLLTQWYNVYLGHWTGDRARFGNNLSIPFTFAQIQSLVARIVQTLFGSWPIVAFEGYAPEDQARAKKNEVLISAQMRDCDIVRKMVDFFLQEAICGTGVLRYGWKTVQRTNRIRKMESIAPGLRIPVVREYEATLFDGPDVSVVDRLDFWQQPARKFIDDMDWVIHRYWLDWDTMMEDAKSDYPYFDPSAVRLLKDHPMQEAQAQEFTARKLTFRNEYDYAARQRERFAKPVEIWEMHGLVPSEFAKDGIRHRCIAIGNGRVVLKNREGPMPDQSKPFISYCSMPDPFGFDGVAKVEIASKPQRIADRLSNQKLDALDTHAHPMWAMSSQVNFNQQNLFTRPGRVFLTDGPADESNIRALSPDLSPLQNLYQEVQTQFQFMQLGLGANDILLGQGSPQRETARGFLGRQENTLNRLGLETTLAEQMVEKLGDAFRKLNRLHLDTPTEIKVLGSLATINPITGLPYAPELVQIDEDDLAADYRSRALGAAQMMGKSLRQQNFIGVMQVLTANPVMMQIINWPNLARQALELFDFKNVDELLVSMVPMVNQMGVQGGPAGPGGPGASNLENLDPQILTQMLGQSPGTMQNMVGGG